MIRSFKNFTSFDLIEKSNEEFIIYILKKNSKSLRQTNENQLILGSNFLSERFAGRSEFKLVFRKKEWTKTQESED